MTDAPDTPPDPRAWSPAATVATLTAVAGGLTALVAPAAGLVLAVVALGAVAMDRRAGARRPALLAGTVAVLVLAGGSALTGTPVVEQTAVTTIERLP